MIFWLFFLSFLFSVTAGLSLFLLNGRRHSLAAWVLVAALTLMAAQQGLRALHATAATPAVVTAYTRMGLGFWPGIMVLASGIILNTRWWVRGYSWASEFWESGWRCGMGDAPSKDCVQPHIFEDWACGTSCAPIADGPGHHSACRVKIRQNSTSHAAAAQEP